MTMEKEEIRNNLDKILIYYGAKPGKTIHANWTCLASRHKNPQNNLSVKENKNICCCHCGIQGDSFDVIAEIENIDKNDFASTVQRAREILNLPEIKEYKKNSLNGYKNNNGSQNIKNTNFNFDGNSITQKIDAVLKSSKFIDYKYFFSRGLTKEIILSQKIIISNPKKIFPREILPKCLNIWAYEYIIPILENGKFVNAVLRRNDEKSMSNSKTLNLKGLDIRFLNEDYLSKDNMKNIFICEAWADALSFESLGANAISLHSITGINRLTSIIKENHNKLENTNFYITFDNDLDGSKAAKKLYLMLKEINIKVKNLKLIEYKDVNEYLTKDKNKFKASIKEIIKLYG